ncbi:hypothetical protein [Sandarakinorhabdus sp.]|uniref:hypothetical protein n=1 Tax=Sandarakinorhabdus sp. TaxID=1916663 RepID=UPI003F7171A2
MAKVKINLKDLLDEHVKPVARSLPGGEFAYNGLMGIIGGALDRDFEITVPDLPGLPSAPVAPSITPIDPARALNDIAKAIKQAETTLLGENLSIRNASVDVELTVAVAGAAGATAKFNLEIGPAPSD